MAIKLYSTSIALPAPFIANSCDPVDGRVLVENFTDLTTNAGDTFGVINGIYCKIYEGMTVYVSADKSTYMYVGPSDSNGVQLSEAQKTSNWRKTSDPNTSSDQITDTLEQLQDNIDSAFTRINTVSGNIQTTITRVSGAAYNLFDSVSDRVTTLSAATHNRINTLSANTHNRINSVNDRVTTLSGRVVSLSSATDTRMDTIEDNIDTLSGNTHNRINSVNSALSATIYSLSSSTDSRMTEIEDEIDEFSAATHNRINTVSGNIQTTITRVSGAAYNLFDSVSDRVTTLSGVVHTLSGLTDGRLDRLETSASGLNSIVSTIEANINNMDMAQVTFSAGQVLSAISQTNGKISVTKRNLTASDIPSLPISKITNLQDTLDGKSSTSHNHDSTYSKLGHGHNISEIDGLQGELDTLNEAITNIDVSGDIQAAINGLDVPQVSFTGTEVPSTITQTNGKIAVTKRTHNHDGVYATAGHNHDGTYSKLGHTHSISNITNLQEELDALNEAITNKIEIVDSLPGTLASNTIYFVY